MKKHGRTLPSMESYYFPPVFRIVINIIEDDASSKLGIYLPNEKRVWKWEDVTFTHVFRISISMYIKERMKHYQCQSSI